MKQREAKRSKEKIGDCSFVNDFSFFSPILASDIRHAGAALARHCCCVSPTVWLFYFGIDLFAICHDLWDCC